MSDKPDQLRALARFCRRHGGQLAIVSQCEFDDLFDVPKDKRVDGELHESPFTSAHGLHWRRKIVYTVREREEVGSIIHEMGHVFADVHHPEDERCREWNWLGWEIALARQVDAMRTWSRQNANYETGESGWRPWRALTTKRRRIIVADRIAHAKKIGVVDANGVPRSIR
jgi:hypothetical protein